MIEFTASCRFLLHVITDNSTCEIRLSTHRAHKFISVPAIQSMQYNYLIGWPTRYKLVNHDTMHNIWLYYYDNNVGVKLILQTNLLNLY